MYPGVPLRGAESAIRQQNLYSLYPSLHETNFSEQYKKYTGTLPSITPRQTNEFDVEEILRTHHNNKLTRNLRLLN